MASAVLTIPDEVKADLKRFSWVNWSELAREELIKQEKDREAFERFKKIVSKSKLTEQDAIKLGREVNKGMHKKLKKLHPELL